MYKVYIYIYIRGAFNKFQDFLGQAFKFVEDSWKLTMLLLYILWDDGPIFMISGSNEQLQQQLEYTLLKTDCHSWWMKSGREDSLEERYAMKFCFKLGKNDTETYGMLQTAFGLRDSWKAGSLWGMMWGGKNKEVRTSELIGQRARVRVRVTLLRF